VLGDLMVAVGTCRVGCHHPSSRETLANAPHIGRPGPRVRHPGRVMSEDAPRHSGRTNSGRAHAAHERPRDGPARRVVRIPSPSSREAVVTYYQIASSVTQFRDRFTAARAVTLGGQFGVRGGKFGVSSLLYRSGSVSSTRSGEAPGAVSHRLRVSSRMLAFACGLSAGHSPDVGPKSWVISRGL
jgi:hypothetical protein